MDDPAPFIKLSAARKLGIPWLPRDLRGFYRTHEGVGLDSSSDRHVRLCKLRQLRRLRRSDVYVLDSLEATSEWQSFDAILVGTSSYGDQIVYALDLPVVRKGGDRGFWGRRWSRRPGRGDPRAVAGPGG
jgi:hypothetical protein